MMRRSTLLLALLLVLLAVVGPVQAAPAYSGVTWGEPVALTPIGQKAVFPSVAIDSAGATHVIYLTDDGASTTLWYMGSAAGGGFGTPQAIEPNIGSNREPFFALAAGPGGALHLVYAWPNYDNQVYYRHGVIGAGRVSWSAREPISDALLSRAFAATLAVDAAGNVHIAWIDNRCGAYVVRYRVRQASGALGPVSAPLDDCVFQNHPRLGLTRDGSVHLVFQHDRDIVYAHRDGSGWSVRDFSASPATNSYNPVLASDGTALYVAWEEGTNGHDVLFRRSRDGGRSWSSTIALSNTPAYATAPTLATSSRDGQVTIAWADATGMPSNATAILHRRFDPPSGITSAASWLSGPPGPATLPTLAAGARDMALVWQDKGLLNWRVLLRHATVPCAGAGPAEVAALPAGQVRVFLPLVVRPLLDGC